MSDKKVLGIDQAAKKRERLKEVAKAFVEDISYVKVLLRRSLAPVVGNEVLETLARVEEAANYWYRGQEGDLPPGAINGIITLRYHRKMADMLRTVATKLEENRKAEGLTGQELAELAMVLEFGAEHIKNYLAVTEIEREIKAYGR